MYFKCITTWTQVNNAAVYPQQWTKADFDSTLATNYRGPVRLTLTMLPFLAPGSTDFVLFARG
jgi:NAD(P)-dependent dehydrogenase (short-subunit alcohol dehydrogenase family)